MIPPTVWAVIPLKNNNPKTLIKSVSSTGQGDPDQGVQRSGGEFSEVIIDYSWKNESHEEKEKQKIKPELISND